MPRERNRRIYLAKVLPMVERFGGRYLTKAGSHEILEGIGNPIEWSLSNFPILYRSKDWVPSTGMHWGSTDRTAQKRSNGRNDYARWSLMSQRKAQLPTR